MWGCYTAPMAFKSAETKNPQNIPVQCNIRLPFRYHEWLKAYARSEGVSVNSMCVVAIEKAYPAILES